MQSELWINVIGLICGICVIMLLIFKLGRKSFKWYTLNVLVALSITQFFAVITVICQNQNEEVMEMLVLISKISFEKYIKLVSGVGMWSFSLVRLVMLCSLLEIYCIYTFQNNILSRFYQRVWLPRILMNIIAVSLSTMVVMAFGFDLMADLATELYCAISLTLYFTAVVVLCLVI
ncbi:unnamed protein product [Gongylonema pulchrum]|uniref:G_PROTEIN_RECEP_F1_2 domain-containing protein n=1 Tax=Gongylonema pulchrum TaxID=637853 RepID=A0A183DVV2_9BILA|nr:unnamed protein product [Gongylonema pulchrum]